MQKSFILRHIWILIFFLPILLAKIAEGLSDVWRPLLQSLSLVMNLFSIALARCSGLLLLLFFPVGMSDEPRSPSCLFRYVFNKPGVRSGAGSFILPAQMSNPFNHGTSDGKLVAPELINPLSYDIYFM